MYYFQELFKAKLDFSSKRGICSHFSFTAFHRKKLQVPEKCPGGGMGTPRIEWISNNGIYHSMQIFLPLFAESPPRTLQITAYIHRRKMSAHALLKMTRDLFRAMSLALRQKYPRNVVEMKEAMLAFFGSYSVAISCHCKRSKIIFIKVLTEVCSLENIVSWNWRKIAVAWSDSVLLTLRSLVCMWKTCRKGG